MAQEDFDSPIYHDLPTYREFLDPLILTLDVKDTKIYMQCTNHQRIHYRTTSSLNRDFVKGGFGLSRVCPFRPLDRSDVYDVRGVGDVSFHLTSHNGRVFTVQRKLGFAGHWWEVRALRADLVGDEKCTEVQLAARKTSKDGRTLSWRDANGSVIATDTRLIRRRGNHENHFLMPVLSIVAPVNQETLDLLVAAWTARVWSEIVQAKKKTLIDGTRP